MNTANGANSKTRTGGRDDFFALAKEGPELRRGVARRPCDDRRRRRASEQSEKIVSSATRGYVKLSDAARAFNFDFRGKTVLDIGSSTGGFTQYALDHGALKVIAIEKGTNQMLPFLRSDPRVELHEKTDIFDFKAGVAETYLSKGLRLGRAPWELRPRKIGSDRTPAFDIIMADVSFVSLRKVLAHAKAHLANKDTEFLVMLKPQFEARDDQLKKGIIKNESIRRQIIKDFEQWLKNHGFVILKKRDNQLKGKTGNTERFYWLKIAK